MKKKIRKNPKSSPKVRAGNTIRQAPVRIPLSFDQAVEGLLAVKPTKKPKTDDAK